MPAMRRAVPIAFALSSILAACGQSASPPGDTPANPTPAPTPEPAAPPPPPRDPSPRRDASISCPDGFEVELIHEVNPETEGSWVAICARPDGTLYAADQSNGLFRITPPAPDDFETPTRVERVPIEVRGAQGLLWAFDSLYVMETGKGVVRATDTDADGEVDTTELLVPVTGAGEHGAHAINLAPDGESLMIACGNHTPLPETLTASRVPRVWGEDQLLVRDPDPRGHANGVMAPGGYICRISPDGSEVELITCGFRNSYDFAVSPGGDVFAFDSDMEWDLGLPWYRPARVCHAVSGADYGWRNGSGKWPAYYEDSLPPAIDIGPASPTGMIFGTDAAFPERYRRAMFMLDWTYGLIYAVHLEPSGASFGGELEKFVSAKALPLTDVAIGADGALYFTTGGRRLGSKLHRVVYHGTESTDGDIAPTTPTPDAQLRNRLEALHRPDADPGSIDFIWEHLSNGDRFVRYAARIALEHQATDRWRERALSEPDASKATIALLALARHASPETRGDLLDALVAIDPSGLDEARRLALLRAFSLAFIRTGLEGPAGPTSDALIAAVQRTDASDSPDVDLERARVLIALGDPSVIDPCLARMSDTSSNTPPTWAALAGQNDSYGAAIKGMLDRPPPTRALAYAHALSNNEWWTFQQLQTYFTFLQRAASGAGGMSYRGFIDAMRNRALATCTDYERTALAPLLTDITSAEGAPAMVFPKGPWRDWKLADATRAVATLQGRSFDRGAGLYLAASCASCHQFNGSGSNVGPDLTTVGRTYSTEDLVRAIIQPSFAVTDQYAVSVVTKTDGTEVSGLLVESTPEEVRIAPNFASPDTAFTIPRADIASIEHSSTSPMPVGLVNPFNEDELRDLVAYLVSGGDPDDAMFK